MLSPAAAFGMLPESERKAQYAALSAEAKASLLYSWRYWARPEQLEPTGDWLTWLLLSGRGFGKTRTGAEWIRSVVCGPTPLAKGQVEHVALIAETAADARDVLVEKKDGGVLAVHPRDFRPIYEPSKRRLTWPNGATGTLYNGSEPDQLRGPEHGAAWCDELAKWRYGEEAYSNMMFGLRLGSRPRKIITTTPRPIPIIRQLIADPTTYVTRGKTTDNIANLPESFLADVERKYGGTRLGRQELNGEVLDDVPGALWTRDMLDKHRLGKDRRPEFQRVVVAIDPAGKAGDDDTAETGIVVAALGIDGRGYVLDDLTCSASPHGWASRAVSAYDLYDADAIIVETNFGGDMVKMAVKSVRQAINVIEVHASRGKVTRAEPIAALYEQGRISHIGSFAALEDQMVCFTPFGIVGDGKKDRADALVWALTNLFSALIRVKPEVKAQPAGSHHGDMAQGGWMS